MKIEDKLRREKKQNDNKRNKKRRKEYIENKGKEN